MENRLLHTPDGVRDIYNLECEGKQRLENNLMAVMNRFGYRAIQTPTFEFFDVFSKEIKTTPSRELYKFFDRDGNTLVLRPEFTPPIARCAATYFQDRTIPLRLCYIGNTFINNNSYQGNLKERTQAGAELIGDDSAQADAEMIALSVEMLRSSGLREFQISIGHTDILRGLFEAADLDAPTKKQIIDLIHNHNFYGVEEVVDRLDIDETIKALFSRLRGIDCKPEQLLELKDLAADYPVITGALDRLMDLDKILEYYDVRRYVSYEPALISELKYYTGIIFAGYTFGSGEAILTGGRYDTLLRSFGMDAPAIGFAIVTDQLLAVLKRQGIYSRKKTQAKWILYHPSCIRQALEGARALREEGACVEVYRLDGDDAMERYETYAKRFGIEDVIYYLD